MTARVGATPDGAVDEASASAAVQQMFDEIAPKYDLLNHVMSAGVDRYWWRKTAKTFEDILKLPESRVIDLCCGTGDMTAALLELRPEGGEHVVGVDFSHNMLEIARRKLQEQNAIFIEADALHLPTDDATVDLVVSTFGFRNLADYDAGLREIRRVLRSGGRVGILEASEPTGLWGRAYGVYFHHILPRIGSLLSGNKGAYEYFPRSVARFPKPDAMCAMMREAGLKEARWTPFTFGLAGLFTATV